MQESQLPSLWFTFVLCSILLPPFIAAQPSSTINSSEEEDESLESATMAILVLVVVSAILFLGSFSLWIQNCCVDSSYSRSRSRSRVRLRGQYQGSLSTGPSAGVDKSVIDSFPTIVYSAAKGMKIGVECAVCLSEFSGEETLRILPSCDHVFHLHCIARWLANQTTCPVCRARVMDNCSNPMEMEPDFPLATAIDVEASAGDLNLASASEFSRDLERFTVKLLPVPDGVKEAKLKVKRWSSCENLSGEGSGSEKGRSERWGASVAPLDCIAVKGDDGAGDRFAIPPV